MALASLPPHLASSFPLALLHNYSCLFCSSSNIPNRIQFLLDKQKEVEQFLQQFAAAAAEQRKTHMKNEIRVEMVTAVWERGRLGSGGGELSMGCASILQLLCGRKVKLLDVCQ